MTTQTNLRPELAGRLRQRLEAFAEGFRHNLAIIGPVGSGKTFQLQQLLADHPRNLTLVYCPLYRESCRSFLNRLLTAILQAGIAPAAARDTSPHALEELLGRAEPLLPKTVTAIRSIEPLIIRRLYAEAFTRALDTIPLLTEERQQPCALILDEFLFLEDLGLIHAFHELGKRVMTWPTTLFILCSSSTYRARTILRERLQLLFGQFELLTMESVDAHASTTWVLHELKGLRGAKAMSPFLLRWLGGYPWYLSVFLRRLRELATLANRAELSEALFLHTAWDVLGSPEGPLHQWCVSRTEGLSHARLGPRAIDALIQIAQGARTTTEIGRRIGRAGLSNALQLLVERDLAQRNGMCWVVSDPVLRCWLSTILSLQRADASLEGASAREAFDRYLQSLWAQWVQADQLSFPQQVASLFSRFCEDTVSIDSKTGRLPRFQTVQTQRPGVPGVQAYLVADGAGKRWCATIQEGSVDEAAITHFDAFCKTQAPKPSRKLVITKAKLDPNAKLLAKTANMWVWEAEELTNLLGLYGQL